MKEFNIEIEIDENGNIIADTRGFHGKVCERELDELLEGLDGEAVDKKKPEYFVQEAITNKTNIKSKLH